MQSRSVIFLAFVLLSLGGCSPYTIAPGVGDDAPYLACADGNADDVFEVPVNFDSGERHSGSGGYHYCDGCRRYVVDVTLTNLSNCGPYDPKEGYLGPCSVKIGASAHDLPSSKGYGGTEPTVPEDCNRYRLRASFFSKHVGDPYFKYITSETMNFSGCARHGSASIIADAPAKDKPWKIYRVAAELMLRSSAQEVKVVVGQPPIK